MNFKKPVLKMLVLCIITLSICTNVNAQERIKFEDLTFEQAMTESAKTGKIIFVDVQNNNPNAMVQKVEDSVFVIDSIAEFFNRNIIPIRVNMNTEEGKKFAPRLAMLMYPVYVFHDKKGDQLSFTNAYEILNNSGELMEKAIASLRTAQEKETNTRHIAFDKSNWNTLLAKAKKENKLIFVDAYTEWCRPCIQMAKDVFTLDNVADFYNENFINVSMDMEKGEGPELVKKYKVQAYPAFLYINGDGKLVHRDGGYQEAPAFIKAGKAAINSKKK